MEGRKDGTCGGRKGKWKGRNENQQEAEREERGSDEGRFVVTG